MPLLEICATKVSYNRTHESVTRMYLKTVRLDIASVPVANDAFLACVVVQSSASPSTVGNR
jgi:hypothetical protein